MMELETETETQAEPEENAAEDELLYEPAYDTSSLGPVVGPIESDIFAGFRGRTSGFNYAIWLGYAVTGLIATSLFIGVGSLPAKPATLIVTTTPPDVTLIVDGHAVAGRSPFRLDDLIPEGDHVIEIQRAGFQPRAHRVTLAPGEIRTLRDIALVPLPSEPPAEPMPHPTP
jgi:hypothetical protein